jgi:hypothetical protein
MALFRCRKEVSPLGIGVCASGKEVSASRKEVSALGKKVCASGKEASASRKEASALGNKVCASGKEVSASRKEVSALGKELSAKKKSSFAVANRASPNRWQIRGIEDLRLECFGKARSVRYELHERKR